MLRGRGGRHRNRGGQQKGGGVRLLQANVGRSGPRTDALLRRADEEHIDIVLVQEPGGYWAPGKECSRTSKSYQALLPNEGSGTRPRVVTYVRKTGLQWTTSLRQDLLPEPSDDVLILSLTSATGAELWVVNTYNAPSSSQTGPGEGAALLQRLGMGDRICVAVGDFNLHHADWAADTWVGVPTEEAEAFAEWVADGGWSYGLPLGTITHLSPHPRHRDSAIDLVLASRPLRERGWMSGCSARQDWSVGSDHIPVLTTIGAGSGGIVPPPPAFSLKQADWERCRVRVSSALPALGDALALAEASRNEEDRIESIDVAADLLQATVQQAMEEAVPRRGEQRWGLPHWNAACTAAQKVVSAAVQARTLRIEMGLRAVAETATLQRASSQLARVVAEARRVYHRSRLDELQGSDIYAAAKWALGRRTYPSPPLRDAAGSIITDAEEKRTLLRDTLLPPLASPPRPPSLAADERASSLPHQPVTWMEVRTALFASAPNKAAGPDDISFAVLRELCQHTGSPEEARTARP
ncbi:hypothetical protein CF326_g7778 [Tilletia indica]|nr:hypothetical protein CF326_g7778 [Tilletia indica]